jgi:hypothetical protein
MSLKLMAFSHSSHTIYEQGNRNAAEEVLLNQTRLVRKQLLLMQQGYEGEYPANDESSIQRRMTFIVVWVVIMALLAIALVSRISNGAALTILSDEEVETSTAAVNPVAGAAQSRPAFAASNALISPIFSPEVQHWAPLITQIADDFGIDPDIVATVMQIESCGFQDAESHAGAQGLFQVMPFHFGAGEVMKDPQTNAFRGAKYLAEGLAMTAGNVNLTLAGYNGGHGTAQRAMSSWPNEMQRYYYWGSGIYADAKAGKAYSERLDEWMRAGGANLCNQAAARIGLMP